MKQNIDSTRITDDEINDLIHQLATGDIQPNFDSLYDDIMKTPTIRTIKLDSWLYLIENHPNWWIFRGPLNPECYDDGYKETLINWLLYNPDLLLMYFTDPANSNGMASRAFTACAPVRKIFLEDDRICSMIMMLT